MYDHEVIEYAKEQEEIISKLEYRIYATEDGRTENRETLMRDYARVLYSSSFRRLQGKMVSVTPTTPCGVVADQ